MAGLIGMLGTGALEERDSFARGVRPSRAQRGKPCHSARLSRERSGRTNVAASETLAPVRLRGHWDRAVEVRSCAVKSRAVSNRNCVAAMRGGEQRNEKGQSATTSRHTETRELNTVGVDGRVFG